ncbi:MAG: hypothetical protein ACYTHM_11155 [Planctomycetota bacterium]|jgi:hypothetical protein
MDRVRDEAREFSFAFGDFENPHIRRQLPPSTILTTATRGHCDCGTSLGAARALQRNEDALQKKVAGLRRKGWTDKKIQRWMEDKKKSEARRAHSAGRRFTPDLENWIACLNQLLNGKAAESVGILFHMYRGLYENENFTIFDEHTIRLKDLDRDALLTMQEDEYYRVAL